MDIKPLEFSVSDKGGRPTKYRDSLADEIPAYLEYGLSPDQILSGLGTNMNELKRWANKKGMLEAYEQMQEALSDEAKDDLIYHNIEDGDYDTQLEHGEIEAVRTLRLILRTASSDSAKVQAAKELLDRKRGKPVQTTHVEQNTTYTIITAIPAPPNSHNALPDIQGDCEAITE